MTSEELRKEIREDLSRRKPKQPWDKKVCVHLYRYRNQHNKTVKDLESEVGLTRNQVNRMLSIGKKYSPKIRPNWTTQDTPNNTNVKHSAVTTEGEPNLRASANNKNQFTVISSKGLRVEGLSFSQVKELLEK